VWFIAIVIALDNAGYNIGTILAGFGISGIAVAMATKDTISNMIGGINIMLFKPFKVGDLIKIKEHNPAFVRTIGLRCTKVEDFITNTTQMIPNNLLIDSVVENISDWAGKLHYEEVKLSLNNDSKQIEKAIDLIRNIINNHNNINKLDRVIFKCFDDIAFVIQYVYNVTEFKNRHIVKNEVNLKIKHQFEENNIEIANLPFELFQKLKK